MIARFLPENLKPWWQQYAGSVAFVLVVAIGAAGYFANAQNTDTLREDAVTNCAKITNPTRAIIANQLQNQVDQSKAFLASGKYAEFFPGIPPAELNALIQKQNQQYEDEIAQLAPLDCGALFPK